MDVETSQAMIHPDDAPAVRAAVAGLADTGKADVEYRQKTKNGDYRWLSNHMSLVKDSSGRPLYRNGNIRDITESKQAEAEREALLAELKAIVASMPDGLITYKQGAPGATINPAAHRILGVPAEDWPRTIAERARLMQVRNEAGLPVDADASPAARALRGETIASEIMRLQRPDGEERWVSVGAAPIITATGEQIGALTLFSDITERRHADEALRAGSTLLNSVLESSLSGIMAFKSIRDAQGRITDFEWQLCNATAERMVGRRATDLVGRKLLVEMPGNKADGLFDKYVVVVETGRPLHHEHYYEHEGLKTWFETSAVQLGRRFRRDLLRHHQPQAGRGGARTQQAKIGRGVGQHPGRLLCPRSRLEVHLRQQAVHLKNREAAGRLPWQQHLGDVSQAPGYRLMKKTCARRWTSGRHGALR